MAKASVPALIRIVGEGLRIDDFRAEALGADSFREENYAIESPLGSFVLRFNQGVGDLAANIKALTALKGLDVAPHPVTAGWCEGIPYTFEERLKGTQFPYEDLASKERVLPAIVKRLELFKKAHIEEFEKEKAPDAWVRSFLKKRLLQIWKEFPNSEIIAYLEKHAPKPEGLQLIHGEPYWKRILFHEGNIRFVHFLQAALGEAEADPGVLYFLTPVSDACLQKILALGHLKPERLLYHALLFGVKSYLASPKKREQKMERIETLWKRR